ncbi:MAG: hypothetical protein AD742_11280 [Methylibium sp. NZG]|nr:MAG: hypothetical protein AD742_11280 [Methylibium sp. NZG]
MLQTDAKANAMLDNKTPLSPDSTAPPLAEEAAERLRERMEAEQLRVRVIALENLVIALLAQVPVEQLALARDMAGYISPRPGCTPHHLTLRAADEMRSLLDRATPFRATQFRVAPFRVTPFRVGPAA